MYTVDNSPIGDLAIITTTLRGIRAANGNETVLVIPTYPDDKTKWNEYEVRINIVGPLSDTLKAQCRMIVRDTKGARDKVTLTIHNSNPTVPLYQEVFA